MPTNKQVVGKFGEKKVVKHCPCPSCKHARGKLVGLPPNFKCADLICDFCGYLAQVKTSSVPDPSKLPNRILGAAWEPQFSRMKAGIFFPLFLVLATKNLRNYRIYYLSADLQTKQMFKPRKPLSENAKRKGWQGFNYDLAPVKSRFVCIFDSDGVASDPQ